VPQQMRRPCGRPHFLAPFAGARIGEAVHDRADQRDICRVPDSWFQNQENVAPAQQLSRPRSIRRQGEPGRAATRERIVGFGTLQKPFSSNIRRWPVVTRHGRGAVTGIPGAVGGTTSLPPHPK
jgi:hypothetical protein